MVDMNIGKWIAENWYSLPEGFRVVIDIVVTILLIKFLTRLMEDL